MAATQRGEKIAPSGTFSPNYAVGTNEVDKHLKQFRQKALHPGKSLEKIGSG
jgi:hypothetical protein